MGCGSSSPNAAPSSVSYPKQQYNQPSRGESGGGGGGKGQINRNTLYNDADPTDDIPPEKVTVQEKNKGKGQINRNTLYNDADPTDDIPPEKVTVQGEKKEPTPVPAPAPKVTEKKEEPAPVPKPDVKKDPEPTPPPKVKETKDDPRKTLQPDAKDTKDDPPQPPPPKTKDTKDDPPVPPPPNTTDTKDDPPVPPPPRESTPTTKDTEDKVISKLPEVSPTEDDMDEIEVKKKGEVTNQKATKASVMGRKTTVLDTRPGAEKKNTTERPKVAPGELWTDKSFSLADAFEGERNLEWKRPGDLAPEPSLFTDGTTRFDIGQGSVGTCWFLSIVAAIADKEDIMKQVIPDDAYKIGTPEYDGVFHCRFWKFGEWQDIYIDDCLPVRAGSTNLWGSHSPNDKNEMWVPLLEKAFAKFQGSYKMAEGGWAGDAFIYLTGGVAEKVETKSIKSKCFFSRVENALNSGSVIACSVPASEDGKMGLVGGHAYTLTGATGAELKSGRQVTLFRVRNPWGTEKGEWTGDFSDKSPKWNEVEEVTKEKLNVTSKGDGEFWMTLRDYYKYFKETHICNFTPDFDQDGKEDNLDHSVCIFGEWKGETAAGKEMNDKMRNQRFIFTVPNKKLEANGKLPIVIQFMQYREDRKKDHMFHIRADLYKIEQQFKKPKLALVLDELTNNTVFWGGNSICYRYELEPGEYMILPTTMDPGVEREFLIRLFASVMPECKELKESPLIFMRRFETENDINGEIIKTDTLQHHYGLWKAGSNAGGQVKHRSFEKNPQYGLTVSGKHDAYVMISLKQQIQPEKDPVGFKIFKTDGPASKPLDLKYLWRNYNDTIGTVTGENTFIHSFECASLFCLPPGNYVLVAFLETPDKETRYVLTLGTAKNTQIKVKPMNVEN